MKMKRLLRLIVISSFVFIAYSAASGQAKEIANDTKAAANKAADATANAAEKSAKSVKNFGRHTVEVTENIVASKPVEAGKYYTVKTWDGAKWVSKQVWYTTKKAGTATKNAVKN